MAINDANVARTAAGLTGGNTLALPRFDLPIRLQICPGDQGGIGIANVPFTVLLPGVAGGELFPIAQGTTTADGDIMINSLHILLGPVTVQILGSEYEFSLHTGMQAVGTTAGRQKRLDYLGYERGHLTTPRLSSVPDDGNDSSAHQGAIMNFQADFHTSDNLVIDGVIRPASGTVLRAKVGA